LRILVAPDSFKGSLSAAEVADAVEDGLKRAIPRAQVVKVPLADGGEGTLSVLLRATGGRRVGVEATGPAGDRVEACIGVDAAGGAAVVEMARASGLYLVPESKRDPLKLTSFGTGELIGRALDMGYRRVIVGLGGSATVDGGVGAAQALGGRFTDRRGREVGPGGGSLPRIRRIDLSGLRERLSGASLEVACDVTNPLLGPRGAARVFARQKGADDEAVRLLEEGLRHLARLIEEQLGVDVSQLRHGGAAGGLGAGLHAFCGATLRSGSELVLDAVGFDRELDGADVVVTGEGKIDDQSPEGKVPFAVLRRANRKRVPVIFLVGSIECEPSTLFDVGAGAAESVFTRSMMLAEALGDARRLVADAAERVGRFLLLGSGLGESLKEGTEG